MNITKFSPKGEEQGTFFCLSTSYISAQTAYPILLSQGSDKRIYIKDIVLSGGSTAGTIFLTEQPTPTVINILDPIVLAANDTKSIRLNIPLAVSVGASLRITSEGLQNHSVIINGYII